MLTLATYLEALDELVVDVRGDPATPVAGAACDSRRVVPGDLFCAIPGSREDGFTYVPDALARGAAGVVSERPCPRDADGVFVQVSDAYAAAARAAECAAGYPAAALALVGITGTNGKTTTAYILRDILRAADRRAGMIGTVTYDLGQQQIPAERTTPTPFEFQALLKRCLAGGCETVVLEVSSHALHQHRLGTACVDAAVFTNLSGDHLDYHGTMAAYFEAKRLLFTEYLAPHGQAVVNTDDEWGRRLAQVLETCGGQEVLSYGTGARADARIQDLELSLTGCEFSIEVAGVKLHLRSPLAGRFNAANVAAAACTAVMLGVPAPCIEHAVEACRGAPGRLECIKAEAGFAVYVDYAHTDDALANVLQALQALGPRHILTVFGCGGDRDRSKRPRMGRVVAQYSHRVFVTSDNPRSEDPEQIMAEILAGIDDRSNCLAITDRRDAIRAAVAAAVAGDVVLVAGKGHETTQDIAGVKYPFNDVEEVRAALAQAPPNRGDDVRS